MSVDLLLVVREPKKQHAVVFIFRRTLPSGSIACTNATIIERRPAICDGLFLASRG
jgi:hypothetical protein